MAATLTPLAESTTVAKERARRAELRTVVVDVRNIVGERRIEGMDGGEWKSEGCLLVGA